MDRTRRRIAALLAAAFAVVLVGLLLSRSRVRDAGVPDGAVAEPESARTLPPALAQDPDRARPRTEEAPGHDVAPAPATVATEPSEEDLDALRRPVAKGAIEGIVLRGKTPVADAAVSVRRATWDAYVHGEAPDAPLVATRATKADGTFAVETLDPGDYVVEVVAGGSVRRAVSVVTSTASRAVVVRVGTGAVEGVVRDVDGRPLVGAIVRASEGNERPVVLLETKTDGAGRYRFGDLFASRIWFVFTNLGPDSRDETASRGGLAPVRDGETTRLDFGSERGDATWTGRVVDSRGEPVRGPGVLRLYGNAPTVRTAVVAVDADGAFSTRIASGAYGGEFRPPGVIRRPVALESEVVVGDGVVSRDVVVPGYRFRGRVRSADTGRDLVGTREQWVSWTARGKDHHDLQAVFLAADGTFDVAPVPRGRYVLSGYPLDLVDAAGREPVVDVGPEGAALDLVLDARPPARR